MNREDRILFGIGIFLLVLGSFVLGTRFPTVPNYEYVQPQSKEITTRQNIVSDTDIMLGREIGTVRYRSIYMAYEHEGIHLWDIFGHSIFIHTPTSGATANPDLSDAVRTIQFEGYSFKVVAWNSDYIGLRVLSTPVSPRISDNVITLERNVGAVKYRNITMNYNGVTLFLSDDFGNKMQFTLTHYITTEPYTTGTLTRFSFNGIKFNVVSWGYDYIELEVLE